MRRILIVICISIIFLLSNLGIAVAYEKEIKNLSATISENITSAGKKTVAVVDFTDLQGNITELGRFLAEELSVDLTISAKGFEVIDRTHLKSILTEHKLSISGLVDPNTVKKLGEIAGVDAIVTGSVTPFGDSIRVTCKVIGTDTAKVIGAAKGDIAKTKAIEELLSRGIETGQPASLQTSTSDISYTSSPKSKRIGDITITVKRITVSEGLVTIMLDFFNQSDMGLKLGIESDPTLTDEKGNVFYHSGGIRYSTLFSKDLINEAFDLDLISKLNNDVMVHFNPKGRNINIGELGSIFTLSLTYRLYYSKDKSVLRHTVSFADIKAQKPK